jgi:preprotein translocase subunit SecG
VSWFGLILTLLIVDGVFMAVIVLLQSGKGGGLAAMGGAGGTAADALIGGRQAATLLTKATWVAGSVFLVLATTLSIMSSRVAAPESILREEFQQAPQGQQAPQPTLPGTQPTTPERGQAPGTQPGTPQRGGQEPAAQPPAGSGSNPQPRR